MRARRFGVHLSRCDRPILITLSHQVVHFGVTNNILFRNILNVDTLALFFVDLQVVLHRIQQIFDALVVDLTHGHFDCELDILARVFDATENGANHARDNSLLLNIINVGTLHSMRFTR